MKTEMVGAAEATTVGAASTQSPTGEQQPSATGDARRENGGAVAVEVEANASSAAEDRGTSAAGAMDLDEVGAGVVTVVKEGASTVAEDRGASAATVVNPDEVVIGAAAEGITVHAVRSVPAEDSAMDVDAAEPAVSAVDSDLDHSDGVYGDVTIELDGTCMSRTVHHLAPRHPPLQAR
jgi:hypothetical protein